MRAKRYLTNRPTIIALACFSVLLAGCSTTEQPQPKTESKKAVASNKPTQAQPPESGVADGDDGDAVSLLTARLQKTISVPLYTGADALFHEALQDGHVLTETRVMTTDDDVSQVLKFYKKNIPDFGNASFSSAGSAATQGSGDGPSYFTMDHIEGSSHKTIHASRIDARPSSPPGGKTLVIVMTFVGRDSAWEQAQSLSGSLVKSMPAYSGGSYSGIDGSGSDKLLRRMQLMTSADDSQQVAEFYRKQMPKNGWEELAIARSTNNQAASESDFSLMFGRAGARVHIQINRVGQKTLVVLTRYTLLME